MPLPPPTKAKINGERRKYANRWRIALPYEQIYQQGARWEQLEALAKGPYAKLVHDIIWQERDGLCTTPHLDKIWFWLNDRWHCVGTDDDLNNAALWRHDAVPFNPAYAAPGVALAVQQQMGDYRVIPDFDHFGAPNTRLLPNDQTSLAVRFRATHPMPPWAHFSYWGFFVRVACGSRFVLRQHQGDMVIDVGQGPLGAAVTTVDSYLNDLEKLSQAQGAFFGATGMITVREMRKIIAEFERLRIPFDRTVYERLSTGPVSWPTLIPSMVHHAQQFP
jgi:hypothetical protein